MSHARDTEVETLVVPTGRFRRRFPRVRRNQIPRRVVRKWLLRYVPQHVVNATVGTDDKSIPVGEAWVVIVTPKGDFPIPAKAAWLASLCEDLAAAGFKRAYIGPNLRYLSGGRLVTPLENSDWF